VKELSELDLLSDSMNRLLLIEVDEHSIDYIKSY
jgi:hypothetical protein